MKERLANLRSEAALSYGQKQIEKDIIVKDAHAEINAKKIAKGSAVSGAAASASKSRRHP